MKSKTRQILATAIVTSTLSLLIGGFAVWGSYESEIGIIDEHFNTVTLDVTQSPDDPITAALLSVEQNSFDLTVAFMTPTGEIATLKESRKAVIGGAEKLRVRNIPLQAGEQLVIAASLTDIDRSLRKNLWRLLIFIIFANLVASFVSTLISRSGALALERTQREKMQEFLGDAAHELRTPLTVIKGYAELLEGNKLEGDRQLLAFNRLNSEIKRMESLIADLLILAELGEEKSGEFSTLDLSQLLSESVDDFTEVASGHPIELVIDKDVVLDGSEKYLQRFIANALTNIRVHAPYDVPVRITLKSGRNIKLIIEDGGSGLPADSYGEKIQGLKRFDRSRSRETGGSGLGLSIMSAVVERHKGVLTLRESDLGGLAIEVQLPRT
jgi:signal transduction histidine kinase